MVCRTSVCRLRSDLGRILAVKPPSQADLLPRLTRQQAAITLSAVS